MTSSAVKDGATVPIYYESRLAKLALDEAERPKIDPDFEEATKGEEVERKEKLRIKWAQPEAVVGSQNRLGDPSSRSSRTAALAFDVNRVSSSDPACIRFVVICIQNMHELVGSVESGQPAWATTRRPPAARSPTPSPARRRSLPTGSTASACVT